ncbi:N-acetylneuraminate synthase family protein [Magnetofaba australis]|uniref:Putative N-acetylneuraminic acid synthase domain-containing protein n=1 Tax=Magnetofaba australis IT-1 TaxID=1434232 RepID=A0A1Y2K3K3_9PROT|nr:N-acetylneuraminate synthase family protein [Magnetofaba australis]OSM02257.1 putative N-acetylneuraminic acid synthase domain-containing protein [Magnetofaba australis IT-1]
MPNAIPETMFTLELANNHMGDIAHGIHVIQRFAEVCKPFPYRFSFKMQYRQLDSFIHPDYQGRMDIKYIKRFSETRLSRENTQLLVREISKQGFIPMCTPFDPESVPLIVEDGFEILKIASCSFTDWPLLEAIANTDLPIIASTAGVATEDIDRVVSFMRHRGKDFALMSCVAEYPTPDPNMQMNQIDYLQQRYPDVRIGFSTHENPASILPVAMAVAKGVTLFEKHVAVATEKYPINAYSSTPEQIQTWLETAQKAFELCGQPGDTRIEPTPGEAAALISLRRGVFANRDIAVGERITDADVFMAIPTQEGSITGNDWGKYNHYYATEAIPAKGAVLATNTRMEDTRGAVLDVVKRVRKLVAESGVVIPAGAQLEISHHYGMERFNEVGICMLTVVNRAYCKKLIIVLPGQNHPEQYHKMKEETFHVLHGTLNLVLDGEASGCEPGSVITVEPKVKHAFSSDDGAILEEISSTHYKDDSFYTDEAISQNPNRKTFIDFWME